jgi:hypothetical protein
MVTSLASQVLAYVQKHRIIGRRMGARSTAWIRRHGATRVRSEAGAAAGPQMA